MELWSKGNSQINEEVRRFTVGKDRELDIYLAKWDVVGSIAHARMLAEVGLITEKEANLLEAELKLIHAEILAGDFKIDEGVEDVHSQVEFILTRRLGDTGKKIHSGRSRNDQVLVDTKLFLRDQLKEMVTHSRKLFDLLIEKSEEYKDILMPGYTHLQVAMPSSFGLWFGAYAESISDDLLLFKAAYEIVDQNPLGSAAGYGSSFPLDRRMTTELLGFRDLSYNVINAQMGRGKAERVVAVAIASLAATIGRLAMDSCLFANQNFGFIRFPDELTTGSSIMPHKKNPDVFELIRARCNRLQSLPQDLAQVMTNLPSGYHRDLQQAKELIIPAIDEMRDCIQMTGLMLANVTVNKNILDQDVYQYLFSVEEVNKLVNQGMPFRDAYMKVGKLIEEGSFSSNKKVNHTHEGSIGNLCNDQIVAKTDQLIQEFHFERAGKAIEELLKK